MTSPSPATSGTDVSDLKTVRAALEEIQELALRSDETAVVLLVTIARRANKTLSALARLSQPAAWHPIESAPKDGTLIPVLCPSSSEKLRFGKWGRGTLAFDGARVDGWGDGGYIFNPQPTRWFHLPPPPAEKATP